MTSSAVLFHANCPDGWTSAWVAHRALLATDGQPPTLVPMSYGQPTQELAGHDTLYLVDFSLPHDELVTLTEKHRVVVLDHHQTAIDDIGYGQTYVYPSPFETVLDVDRSGAGITWDYFYPYKPRPALVDYVEDRDLWRFKLPRSREANAYIRTQPYTLEAWDDLADDAGTDLVADKGEGVLLHIEAYCRAAANHAYWCEMGDRRFPIANVTYESCSEVADHLLDVFSTDMAGYFFHQGGGRWQYGFRSRNGATVHDHAKAFGGGGHPQAAGCTVDEILHQRVDG